MNTITLVGRLGQDPETINTKSGNTLVKFSIATNDGFGENKKTNWHKCLAFGKTGEIIAKYVSKGSSLAISGSLDYNQYEKDGVKKYSTQIIVSRFTFVESKGDNKQPQAEKIEQDESGEGNLPF